MNGKVEKEQEADSESVNDYNKYYLKEVKDEVNQQRKHVEDVYE